MLRYHSHELLLVNVRVDPIVYFPLFRVGFYGAKNVAALQTIQTQICSIFKFFAVNFYLESQLFRKSYFVFVLVVAF